MHLGFPSRFHAFFGVIRANRLGKPSCMVFCFSLYLACPQVWFFAFPWTLECLCATGNHCPSRCRPQLNRSSRGGVGCGCLRDCGHVEDATQGRGCRKEYESRPRRVALIREGFAEARCCQTKCNGDLCGFKFDCSSNNDRQHIYGPGSAKAWSFNVVVYFLLLLLLLLLEEGEEVEEEHPGPTGPVPCRSIGRVHEENRAGRISEIPV